MKNLFMKREEVEKIKEAYPKGTKIQLVSMDDPQAPPKGTVGVVNHVDDIGTVHVNWETGSSLGVIPGEDNFRIVHAKVIVHHPATNLVLSDSDLAQWANNVHKIVGGKGAPFSSTDFPERLKGYHCDCGITAEGCSKGEFVLLPKESEDVKEGEKAYMRCIKCGCHSHL